jgi:hypothetical protein
MYNNDCNEKNDDIVAPTRVFATRCGRDTVTQQGWSNDVLRHHHPHYD